MITTTTNDLPGYKIREVRGLVRGITVRSPNLIQGFLGGLKTIIGGRIESYREMCEQAREDALTHLVEHAREKGANAVIALRYESAQCGREESATEVLCYGTAVLVEKTD